MKKKCLWHGNSNWEGGPGVTGGFEWLILAFSGPPPWFPHQFPSTSKKSKPPEVQRGGTSMGPFVILDTDDSNWGRTLKCFKKHSLWKRFTSITDSSVISTPSIERRSLLWLCLPQIPPPRNLFKSWNLAAAFPDAYQLIVPYTDLSIQLW